MWKMSSGQMNVKQNIFCLHTKLFVKRKTGHIIYSWKPGVGCIMLWGHERESESIFILMERDTEQSQV